MQLKVLRGGCCWKINFEIPEFQLNKRDGSHSFVASPWIQHLRSGSSSCGVLASCSLQDHASSSKEVSDQNFVDKEQGEKTSGECSPKMLKTLVTDASCNDQEPSAEENIGEPSDDSNVEENFVEPETNDNVDDEHSAEENIGELNDDGNVADSNSDSEDIDYEVSKSTSYESGFTDTENELDDKLDSKGVGDNVTREESHRHNRKGSDEVRVDSDPGNGHSDSFHSLEESDSDGPLKKPDILNLISLRTFPIQILRWDYFLQQNK
ncbi:hypothetical protein V6N13_059089 [Hibiscus sabdariffa]